MKTRNIESFTNRYIGTVISGLLLSMMAANATYPDGYYDSLEGKCGHELMLAVKAKAVNHKRISYGTSTWNAFKSTDIKTVNGVDYWWDMYSNDLVPASSGHPGMNIEHSVAKSWWGGSESPASYCDIVHLNPSNSDANSQKSNYPMAELASVKWDNGVTFIGTPKSGQGGGATWCYEPADQYKGDFARVFMYMFTIYNDISWKNSGTNWMYDTSDELMFKPWAKELLLRWSANDPVSDKERMRNDGIQKEQQNRNPFIDLPDLAEHIWGSKKTVPFSLSGSTDPGTGPGTDPDPDDTKTEYDWLASDAASMGDWTIENIELPSGGSYVWSWREYKGNQYLNGSAYIKGVNYAAKAYAWSPEVSFADVATATLSFSHAAKFQTTCRELCTIAVKDMATGAIEDIPIVNWQKPGEWEFVSSGDIDLSEFSGKKVKIGLKYESTASGADTWEINDMTLKLTRKTTGIEMPAYDQEDDSFLVEVWGNNILAPEGAHIFDLNGREYDGRNLQRGVYIVVKPTFEKAVKILIKE